VADAGQPSTLGPRIVSSLVLGVAAVLVTVAGSWVFALAILAIAVLMAWEWLNVIGMPKAWPLFGGVGLVWIAAAALPTWATLLVLAASVVGLQVGGASLAREEHRSGWLAAGAAYIGAPLIAILWLRDGPRPGSWIVLWLFAVVWATDVGAFVIGRSIGGIRLAPTWSPKKTWSGAFGGLTGALAAAAVLIDLGMSPRPWLFLIAAGLVSVLGQLGDLVESVVKRRFHRKDSGSLIPGHGGVLDRLDSMVFAAPALALLVALVGGEAWLWRANGE
jgi:phosphatidate cytidylyltransferase